MRDFLFFVVALLAAAGAVALFMAVVTLVGHGIWVLAAMLFRGGRAEPRVACPFCRHPTSPGGARCDWCGRELHTPVARQWADVDAAERQIERLELAGLIDRATARAARSALDEYARRLARPGGAAARGGVSAAMDSSALRPPGATHFVPAGQSEVAGSAEPALDAYVVSEPQGDRPAVPTGVGATLRAGDVEREPVDARTAASVAASAAAPGPTFGEPRSASPPMGGLQVPASSTASAAAPGGGRTLPVARRRTWNEALSAFMEERNIRWGELIGGLLIVGSSIALVLSLWDKLQGIRFFPFLVFVAVTSAFLGSGLYAERRWRLRATSHGLLLIGVLLVPLCFLAMAALAPRGADVVRGAMELAALGWFAYLVSAAGRSIAAGDRWRLPLAVVGPSAIAALAGRVVGPGAAPAWLPTAALAALGCFGAAVLTARGPREGDRRIDAPTAAGILTVLGCGALAWLVAVGLGVARSEDFRSACQQIAPAAALAAAAVLVVAIRLRRHLEPEAAVWRMAATCIAAAGLPAMIATVALAWPAPLRLLLVGSIPSAALLWAAAGSRSTWLVSAHQSMLVLTTLLTVTAWLVEQPWVVMLPSDLVSPRGLAWYGLALSAVAAAWVLARIALRATHGGRDWLAATRPKIDRPLSHGLVWALAGGLAVSLGPVLWRELIGAPLTPGAAAHAADAFGPTVWWLWAALAALTVLSLWQRWGDAELVSALLVALALPCLAAGALAGQRETGSALRLGLACAMAVVSTGLWGRSWFAVPAAALRMNLAARPNWPRIARAILLVAAVGPVVALSLAAALVQLGGGSPAQPVAGSFFAELGPMADQLVPMAVTVLVLSGHALCERSAGYAFGAGLLVQGTVVFGYLLAVILHGGGVGTAECVAAVTSAATSAAVWAAIWLAIRRHRDVWRETPPRSPAPMGAERPAASPPEVDAAIAARRRDGMLMSAQLGVGAVEIGGVIVVAVLALVLLPSGWHGWPIAAGSPLGWAALGSLALVAVWRRWQLGDALRPGSAGLVGMAVVALAACTLRRVLPQAGFEPYWSYRALMLGWAAYALLVAALGWRVAEAKAVAGGQGPPQALLRAASGWVVTAAMAGSLMALKAAAWHEPWEDVLWAAATLATAGAAGALMAVWRRREGWALSAGLALNLAASLVVWYSHRALPVLGDWWPRFVQANLIASSAVALLWLAARRQLYALGEMRLGTSPLLAGQCAVAVGGNLLLAAIVVGRLIVSPGTTASEIAVFGEPAAWIAAILAFGAAAWYLRHVHPASLLGTVAGLLLVAGVLAACRCPRWLEACLTGGDLPYGVVRGAWTAATVGLAALGYAGRRWRWAARLDNPPDDAEAQATMIFPPRATRDGVTLVGALCLALAVWHVGPPGGVPVGPLVSVLVLSTVAGWLACWQSLASYVFISGVLVNVAAFVAWTPFGPIRSVQWVSVHALALAVGSIVWLVVDRAFPKAVPHARFDDRPRPYAHLAAALALVLLGWVTLVGLGDDLLGDWLGPTDLPRPGRLEAAALGAVAAAMIVSHWGRTARFGPLGLYLVALCAEGLHLRHRAFTPPAMVVWASLAELAAIALLAALAGWTLPHMRPLWETVGIADVPGRWPTRGFHRAQAALVAVSAALCAWIAIDPRYDGMGAGLAVLPFYGHTQVTPAALMILGAVILMAWQSAGAPRRRWQYAAMATGVLLTSTLGWVWIAPGAGAAAPWLRRTTTLLSTSFMMSALARFGLRRVLGQGSDWIEAGRRAAPVFAAAAGGLLVLVAIQEAWLFDPRRGVPMTPTTIGVVAAVALLLAAACLAAAVGRRPDPLGLDPRGRTLYVYAAEAILAIGVLHLWLTMPWLFDLGLLGRYWMWIVMAVALGGVALAHAFARRGMPVLAEPLVNTALWLPLAPVAGFWLTPSPSHPLDPAGRSPLVWFAIAAFYLLAAAEKRRRWPILLALAATSVGCWSLWSRLGIAPLDHPQLWVIPPALAVLLAEYLERRRLSPAQQAAARYLALGTLYLASISEGWPKLDESWLLPAVTILLAIGGAVAGIVLRVQSFLYLGVACLLVMIARVIHFAAFQRGQMWVLWGFCILLGVAILALFAVFEKRRNDVLEAVRRLRDWQQ